jgi:hypothetical protein
MTERLPWITLALCLALAAPASAQSLADIARQERARQKNATPHPDKATFTNDTAQTLFPVEEQPAPPAKVEGADSAKKTTQVVTPEKPAGPVDKQGRDEKWWRNAFTDARTNLTRAEDQVKVLQIKLNEANRDLLMRSDVYNRDIVIGVQIAGLNTEMEAARKQVDQAKEKIAQLEDDLQKSGGLPGWER